MAFFLQLTSGGGPGAPLAGEKLTLNPLQIIKFWAEGDNSRVYTSALSSQEEDLLVVETVDHILSKVGGDTSFNIQKVTGRGILGGPGNNIPLWINTFRITKFWGVGAGSTIFVTGLSTQQEEIDVQETYTHIKSRLGGVRD